MSHSQASPAHTNRLVSETSPYLLQHAHNPVDWYPWGEEALARARAEDRLILLSIGYSACHWCHVMERESFENERIAGLMNANYVNIKVDREERPDIDDVYMAATLAMNNGQGGWPMTVFITPDLKPVFAGTYFPPDDIPGRPGFTRILEGVVQAWQENRGGVLKGAADLTSYLQQQKAAAESLSVRTDDLDYAAAMLGDSFDPEWGGFGPPPKFPGATTLSLLLRIYHRKGDALALAMARKTLDAMAAGGMYDHVGGGFARYSTDREWLAPHFEKMLYDNALLAKVYLEAYQVTGSEDYRRVATEILDYVLRDMTSPEGGLYSSTDADSEGVEGKFFVWTPAEIRAVLEPGEAEIFCNYYDITERGNWEGSSIPRTLRPLEDVASDMGMATDEFAAALERGRREVYRAREQRVHPGLDDKVLTSWNGMMIGALAFGYLVLRDDRYLTAATRAARFVTETLMPGGRLLRTCRDGQAHIDAFLEDYAYLAEGLIDLYEAGGDAAFLTVAQRLGATMLAGFRDDDRGLFYATSEQHDDLPLRYHEGADGAVPSANAVAASVLLRLSRHFDDASLREAALAAVNAYGTSIRRYPRAFPKSLITADMMLHDPMELALVGPGDSDDLRELGAELGRHFLPNRILAQHDPARGESAFPLLRGKTMVDGKPALYVCRNFTCERPVTAAAEVRVMLGVAG